MRRGGTFENSSRRREAAVVTARSTFFRTSTDVSVGRRPRAHQAGGTLRERRRPHPAAGLQLRRRRRQPDRPARLGPVLHRLPASSAAPVRPASQMRLARLTQRVHQARREAVFRGAAWCPTTGTSARPFSDEPPGRRAPGPGRMREADARWLRKPAKKTAKKAPAKKAARPRQQLRRRQPRKRCPKEPAKARPRSMKEPPAKKAAVKKAPAERRRPRSRPPPRRLSPR